MKDVVLEMLVNKEEILEKSYTYKTTYIRDEVKDRIVHIGFGAFHRGHQAVFTDLANDITDDRWGIFEVNMFGPDDLIKSLRSQDCLLTVIETSVEQTHSRLVRSIKGAIHTPLDGIKPAIEKMAEEQIAIISLTITEKGYCSDPKSGILDFNNTLIQHDLKNPSEPISAIGLITEAIRVRRERDLKPFSVMSCDNIPENGILTKNAVLAYAKCLNPDLGDWIEANITFPCTMVDRIVPAMTSEQFNVIEAITGYKDPCGIVTEDFRQWAIEDNFVAGHPAWDKVGAILVKDVLPYEEMKLRMLNGTHSFLAYNGSLAGHEFIYQCMQDENMKAAAYQLMTQEQAKSLNPDLNADLDIYARNLIERFSNTNVKHKTGQIAQDGSQKLPQRALDPFLELQKRGVTITCLPVLIAGWMHYIIQLIQRNEELVDPMVDQFKEIVEKNTSMQTKAQELLVLDAIFGKTAAENTEFRYAVESAFAAIEREGIDTVIASLSKN